ncbi:hypothetical protein HYG93_07570 [Acinetobacter sp. SwsAc6]|uniref:hypothetical protein n=1 Tax=Acinetobacter sp. SwsAc6 TaxID=2749439 RepID=UPI0015BD005F|nr:hypothetical protein [Acinetobacter sp. SwsAc6]NWK74148.1 hypothetical protein [Acinetobacter sp. SwsAc6]
MTRNQNIRQEIRHQLEIQNHLGACTTTGKSDKEIAHIDERFFLACEKLEALQAGFKRITK